MPKKSKRIPQYRLHKKSGNAVVTLTTAAGRVDVYLGLHDSPESREAYDRTIARWLESGRVESPRLRADAIGGPTITEMCLAFWQFAQLHYRRRVARRHTFV